MTLLWTHSNFCPVSNNSLVTAAVLPGWAHTSPESLQENAAWGLAPSAACRDQQFSLRFDSGLNGGIWISWKNQSLAILLVLGHDKISVPFSVFLNITCYSTVIEVNMCIKLLTNLQSFSRRKKKERNTTKHYTRCTTHTLGLQTACRYAMYIWKSGLSDFLTLQDSISPYCCSQVHVNTCIPSGSSFTSCMPPSQKHNLSHPRLLHPALELSCTHCLQRARLPHTVCRGLTAAVCWSTGHPSSEFFLGWWYGAATLISILIFPQLLCIMQTTSKSTQIITPEIKCLLSVLTELQPNLNEEKNVNYLSRWYLFSAVFVYQISSTCTCSLKMTMKCRKMWLVGL